MPRLWAILLNLSVKLIKSLINPKLEVDRMFKININNQKYRRAWINRATLIASIEIHTVN